MATPTPGAPVGLLLALPYPAGLPPFVPGSPIGLLLALTYTQAAPAYSAGPAPAFAAPGIGNVFVTGSIGNTFTAAPP